MIALSELRLYTCLHPIKSSLSLRILERKVAGTIQNNSKTERKALLHASLAKWEVVYMKKKVNQIKHPLLSFSHGSGIQIFPGDPAWGHRSCLRVVAGKPPRRSPIGLRRSSLKECCMHFQSWSRQSVELNPEDWQHQKAKKSLWPRALSPAQGHIYHLKQEGRQVISVVDTGRDRTLEPQSSYVYSTKATMLPKASLGLRNCPGKKDEGRQNIQLTKI